MNYFKADLPAPFSGDGTEDFSVWCRRLEVAVNANPHLHTPQLSALLPAKLSGAAFTLWDSLSADVKNNYDRVKSALAAVFVKHQSLQKFQTCINARPRLPGEPLEVFAAEISRLCREAFPDYGQTALNSEGFRRFVAGLSPYLQLKIHEQGVKTLPEALKRATQIERAHEASQISIGQSPTITPTPVPTIPPSTLPQSSPTPPTVSVNSIDTTLVHLFRKLDTRLDDLHYELSRRSYNPRSHSPHRSSYSSYRRSSPSPPRNRRSNSPYPRSHHDDYDTYTRESRRESRSDSRARYDSRDRRDNRNDRPRRDSRDGRDSRDTRDQRNRRFSRSSSRDRGRSPSRQQTTSSSSVTRHVTFPHESPVSSQNQGNSH